jgi:hypothetical protein
MNIALTPATLSFGVQLPGKRVLPERLQEYLDAGGSVADDQDPVVGTAAALCQRLITAGRFTVQQLTNVMAGATSVGASVRVVDVTADYVAQPGDALVRVDTTLGDVTITMPNSGLTTARKESSDANYLRIAGIDAASGDPDTNTQGGAVTTRGNGTNAEVVA